MELKELYDNRFSNEYRNRNVIWLMLCASFFQKFIPENYKIKIVAGIIACAALCKINMVYCFSLWKTVINNFGGINAYYHYSRI